MLPIVLLVANVMTDSDDLLPGYFYFGTLCAGLLFGNQVRKNALPGHEAALSNYEREWVCKTCARRFLPIPESLKR